MTNEQIIYEASKQLVLEGKLKTVTVGGVELPEAIHTFAGWKERGYIVKKGEKSDIRINIWKHTTKMKEVDGKEEERSSMFMKTAAFFRFDQVEKIA